LIGIKEGFNSGQKMSKIMLTLSAMFAEMERDRISERTREALALRKADGVVLGRRKGFRLDITRRKLYKVRDELADLVSTGQFDVSRAAEKYGVARKTVREFIADIAKVVA
jgi:DNA invertase Pin-like site-specific DNA recombinase